MSKRRRSNDGIKEWLVDDDSESSDSANLTTTGLDRSATGAAPSLTGQPNISLQIWNQIRQEYEERSANGCQKSRRSYVFYGSDHPGCPHCADKDRETIRELRQLGVDYPNIYSWISLDPENFRYRWPKDLTLLLMGVSVQVIVPLAIAAQQHRNLEDGICPNREKQNVFDEPKDKAVGRLLVFALSLYFGIASINSLLGKLRGNAFLYCFTTLGAQRKSVLAFGFLCQGVGLIAANIAEYLLFVGRGPSDFLLLLFTSTTMLGTLNGDSNNLISSSRSDQQGSIVSKALSDEAMELGEDGTSNLPVELVNKLNMFRKVYDFVTLALFCLVAGLTVAVTYCI